MVVLYGVYFLINKKIRWYNYESCQQLIVSIASSSLLL